MQKKVLSVLSALVLCAVLTACLNLGNGGTSTPATTGNGLTTYRVTVRTQGGTPLENIGVRVFSDPQRTELVWYDKTDAQGSMTFVAAPYDGYVLTLEGLPEEYDAREYYAVSGELTEIILGIELEQDDLSGVRLNPGDAMHELTVTDTQGREQVLSRLLATHKAVALYFFDEPTDAGLACLEQAWSAYAQEIAVLALDPRGGGAAEFAQSGVPLAACDEAWCDALHLTHLPTLVMIDRFGFISLSYGDAVADAQVYRDIFAFYARNDYTAEVISDVQSIIGKSLQGTQENPYTADGSQDILVSLAPGEKVYYQIYRASGQYLSIDSANARVWLAGQLYTPENGTITMPIDTPDSFTPVLLCLENTGSDTELFAARFTYRPGTMNDPFALEPGTFPITLPECAADADNTIYYMYKAEKPGTLRLTCPVQTQEASWLCRLTNSSTGEQLSSQEDLLAEEGMDAPFMLISVSANDTLLLEFATLPMQDGDICPAGSFLFTLAYEGDLEPEPTEPVGNETDFTVTARDSFGTALPGVTVTFVDTTGETVLVTGSDGTVSYTAPFGEVDILLTPPHGYTVPRTQLHLTADRNNVVLTFTGSMEDATAIDLPVGTAYVICEGENELILNAGADNYFLFTPAQLGVYRFTLPAAFHFWAADHTASTEQSERLIVQADGVSLTVTEEEVGSPLLIGISGIPYGTLTVEYLGIPEPPAPAPTDPTIPN